MSFQPTTGQASESSKTKLPSSALKTLVVNTQIDINSWNISETPGNDMYLPFGLASNSCRDLSYTATGINLGTTPSRPDSSFPGSNSGYSGVVSPGVQLTSRKAHRSFGLSSSSTLPMSMNTSLRLNGSSLATSSPRFFTTEGADEAGQSQSLPRNLSSADKNTFDYLDAMGGLVSPTSA